MITQLLSVARYLPKGSMYQCELLRGNLETAIQKSVFRNMYMSNIESNCICWNCSSSFFSHLLLLVPLFNIFFKIVSLLGRDPFIYSFCYVTWFVNYFFLIEKLYINIHNNNNNINSSVFDGSIWYSLRSDLCSAMSQSLAQPVYKVVMRIK